jgi:hypothetical protein
MKRDKETETGQGTRRRIRKQEEDKEAGRG